MRRLLPLALLPFIYAPAAQADQLQCNSAKVARAAVAKLTPGSLAVAYCSNCADRIKVLRIKEAKAVMGCDFEVQVDAEQLAISKRPVDPSKLSRRTRFFKKKAKFSKRVDLAYFYIQTAPNRFSVLGTRVGGKAEVSLDELALPPKVYEAVGGVQDGPAQAPEKSAVTAPRSGMQPPKAGDVYRVVEYWRHGKRPILIQLMPCLSLDMARGSDTRYECKQPVTGPVAPGTTVYAWSEWLVPRALKDIKGLRLEILYDGKLRLSEPVKLGGRVNSPIVRSTLRAVLSKQKTYTLQITRRGKVLAMVNVDVR